MDKTNTQDLIDRLERIPARLREALSRLEDADSVSSIVEGDWSPTQVLAHMRAANDILEPRMIFALLRDNPPLIAYDEGRWREVMRYDTLPSTDSLTAFSLKRRELLRALRALTPEEWERAGTHEVRGPMTVRDIAEYIANHDEEHLEQIERAAGLVWRAGV